MANTTNLDLVKPAGTDKALVSVLNSNSDKIDAWAGTTNQALSHLNGGTITNVASYADLQTLLSNTVANMGGFEIRTIVFACTTNFETFNNAVWTAIITKNANDYFSALCYPVNTWAFVKVVRNQGGTWYIEDYAWDDYATHKIEKTIRFTNGFAQITFSSDVYLMAVNAISTAYHITGFTRTNGRVGYTLYLNDTSVNGDVILEFYYSLATYADSISIS
jgi:hypothetical protein